jgi:hypothetical protein
MSDFAKSPPKLFNLDLKPLLNPAAAFEHPRAVVEDPDLTLNEKRAILATWVSEACAIEAMSTLRDSPVGRIPVPVDDIFDALRDLDRYGADQHRDRSRRRRSRRRRHRNREGQLSIN